MAGILFENEQPPHRDIVKRGIQTQVVRMGAIRLWSDHRERVEPQGQNWAFVHIGRRAHHTQRHAAPVNEQMVFVTWLGAVGRIGPRVFFLPGSPPRPAGTVQGGAQEPLRCAAYGGGAEPADAPAKD
jgi:hypothetical protein